MWRTGIVFAYGLRSLSFRRLMFLVLILVLRDRCPADFVLYDNGSSSPRASWYSDVSRNQFLADDFMLSETARISRIRWTGVYESGPTNDFFEVRILRDTDPGSEFQFAEVLTIFSSDVSRMDTGLDLPNGLSIYSYQVDLSDQDFFIAANQRLWINVINETAAGTWAWAGDATGRAVFSQDLNNWSTYSGNLDFRLLGFVGVPEPSSAMIWLCISASICLRRTSRSR